MGLGSMITAGGYASIAAEDSRIRGQRMAQNRISMAGDLRNLQRETSGRDAREAMYASTGTGITPMELGELTNVSSYRPPVRGPSTTTTTPGQATSSGGGLLNGGMATGEATGNHGGGFNELDPAQGPGQDPLRVAQMAGLRQELGGRHQLDDPLPNFGAGGPASNPNPQPLPDQVLGGEQDAASVVQHTGDPTTTTTPGAVVSPGGDVSEIRGERAPTRRRMQQIDQVMGRLEEDYQRLLPYAKEMNAGMALDSIKVQMHQLAVQRDQVMMVDALDELASTGNPDNIVQVMNAMGYDMKMDVQSDGRIHIIGADGKTLVEGEPHEVAGHLRVQMNAEFQQKMREMAQETRIETMKMKGRLAGDKLGAWGMQHRGEAVERLKQGSGGKATFFKGAMGPGSTGEQTFMERGGKTFMWNQTNTNEDGSPSMQPYWQETNHRGGGMSGQTRTGRNLSNPNEISGETGSFTFNAKTARPQ